MKRKMWINRNKTMINQIEQFKRFTKLKIIKAINNF